MNSFFNSYQAQTSSDFLSFSLQDSHQRIQKALSQHNYPDDLHADYAVFNTKQPRWIKLSKEQSLQQFLQQDLEPEEKADQYFQQLKALAVVSIFDLQKACYPEDEYFASAVACQFYHHQLSQGLAESEVNLKACLHTKSLLDDYLTHLEQKQLHKFAKAGRNRAEKGNLEKKQRKEKWQALVKQMLKARKHDNRFNHYSIVNKCQILSKQLQQEHGIQINANTMRNKRYGLFE